MRFYPIPGDDGSEIDIHGNNSGWAGLRSAVERSRWDVNKAAAPVMPAFGG
jgi:hypothetical protein